MTNRSSKTGQIEMGPRAGVLECLAAHLRGDSPVKPLLVLAPPASGASKLLRGAYDDLFEGQTEIVPFYFDLAGKDKTSINLARRYLQEFLVQLVAFRRGDAGIIESSPEVCELTGLAPATDHAWIEPLVAACENDSRLLDERSFVRQALSAPLRAAANGVRVAVIIDNFQSLRKIKGGLDLAHEFKEIFAKLRFPYIFSGHRRYLLAAAETGRSALADFEVVKLEPLSHEEACLYIESLSVKYKVETTSQAIDLIAHQFGGHPYLTDSVVREAAKAKRKLTTYTEVEKAYVDSLMGGAIRKHFDSAFNEIISGKVNQARLVGLLNDWVKDGTHSIADAWQKYLSLTDGDLHDLLDQLNTFEVIRLNGCGIDVSKDNAVLADYLHTRHRLESQKESRALVVSDMLAEALKRAPLQMASFYRSSSAIGLRDLLSVFNCQSVPAALLNYEDFKKKYKGHESAHILERLDSDDEQKMALPQIVYTANCVAFYPPISQLSDERRSAVGLGFSHAEYTDENEVVWLAAEVDSKLEADADLVNFWCDRLEMAALMCNFMRFRLWLVTSEGFNAEACAALKDREAYGSSRAQMDLLIKYLKAEEMVAERAQTNEYEIIVPMGEDTEMIAAHALEEIARKHSVPPKAINQIKTALVEACINAAEHSHSPDRKIYQKFAVEDDRMTITVSNRGIKLLNSKAADSAKEINPTEGRRGWGLKLMQKLMDEVKFEQVDEGARISMVKYLKK